MWALGTWESLEKLEALSDTCHPTSCLAVSGAQLVSGSRFDSQVQAQYLESLCLQHTLQLPDGDRVCALLAVEGGAWAGVGSDVVVWGRGA